MAVTFTRRAPGTLRLCYRVRNRAAHPLYLCNQLWKSFREDQRTGQPIFEVLPNLVHVEVSEGAVVVDKAFFQLSFSDGISMVDTPCLTRVAVGGWFEEAVDLPLPLVAYKVDDSRPAPHPPCRCR